MISASASRSPIDCHLDVNFFVPDCFQTLTQQTNDYAATRIRVKADPHWHPVDCDELSAFLGIRVYMSILSLPSMDMYWSTDHMFGNLFVSKIMKRDRFEKVAQYFHVADTSANPARGEVGHDKLAHVRPILEEVRQHAVSEQLPPPQEHLHR